MTKINFDDTAIAFQSKSTKQLKKAYYLFKLVSKPSLVKTGKTLINIALKTHFPINPFIKPTIFAHFCGGENIPQCQTTIAELWKYKVGTILDYSVEGKGKEKDFERCKNEILQTIEKAKDNPAIPFTVFKATGLFPFYLLEKASMGMPLNEKDIVQYKTAVQRIEELCTKAYKNKVRIFIDAEESWIQNAIDEIASDMMRRFNKDEIIVYNTLQMYRHDRLDYLKKSFKDAREQGYLPGYKLVRGAYMEKERERAALYGYPSPIHPNKEATDKAYNEALVFAIQQIKEMAICAGTHNETSSLLLTELMQQNNITQDHPHISFAQLYGMSDHISFNLSQHGYMATKYVPYGPVKDVLPYLIRRAEENTSVAGQTSRELELIQKELKRRAR